MAVIFDAMKFDMGRGKTLLHTGTERWLELLGVPPIPGTNRTVPDDWVDDNGKLVRRDEGNEDA